MIDIDSFRKNIPLKKIIDGEKNLEELFEIDIDENEESLEGFKLMQYLSYFKKENIIKFHFFL